MARTPELMTADRAAVFLGVHRNTLRKWNRAGEGPPRTLKGKRWWYAREALKEWLKSGASSLLHAPTLGGALHSPQSRPFLASPGMRRG